MYIRSFVKRKKKTCSVVSTLNMSLANKRFNVWKMWWYESMLPGMVVKNVQQDTHNTVHMRRKS